MNKNNNQYFIKINQLYKITYWRYNRKNVQKGEALQTTCSTLLIRTATLDFLGSTNRKWNSAENIMTAQKKYKTEPSAATLEQ
jgi:hypothetical protein